MVVAVTNGRLDCGPEVRFVRTNTGIRETAFSLNGEVLASWSYGKGVISLWRVSDRALLPEGAHE